MDTQINLKKSWLIYKLCIKKGINIYHKSIPKSIWTRNVICVNNMCFTMKSHVFWRSEGSNVHHKSTDNRCEIKARTSDAKIVPTCQNIMVKSNPNRGPNQWQIDVNNSETWRPKVVNPIGLAECAGRAEALELTSSPRSREAAADSIAYSHSARSRLGASWWQGGNGAHCCSPLGDEAFRSFLCDGQLPKVKLPCFGKPEPSAILIRGGSDDTVVQMYRRAVRR